MFCCNFCSTHCSPHFPSWASISGDKILSLLICSFISTLRKWVWCTGAQSGCWCFSTKESGDTGHWHKCKGLLDLCCWGSSNWSHKFLFSKETTWAPNSGLAGLIFFTYFTRMGFVSRHFISQNVSGCSVVRLFEILKNCWFWFL